MYLKVLSALLILHLQACYGRVNKSCSKDLDCPANASCQAGSVCFCNIGFIDEIQDKLRCLKEATNYNDPCEKDIQCTGLLGLRAHCKHESINIIGKCVCNADSHFKENICHPNAFIGSKCNVSSDCLIKNRDLQAYCYKEKCVCPPKHIPSVDKKDCLPVAGLNERCESNVTCIVNNSKCEEYCTCKMGFVTSKDSQRCLEAADNLNDNCEEDSQCNEFLKLSKCNLKTNKCDCEKFAHRLEDQCWLTVELNSLCEYDSECFITGDRSGVECRAGSCLCKKGFSATPDGSCNFIAQAGFMSGSSSKVDVTNQFQMIVFLLFIINISSYYS